MENLSRSQLDTLQHLLDAREKALREDTRREVNQQESFVDVATEITDPGDASFANLEVDLGHAAVERDITELRAIDAARTRMQNGTYGECVSCGYPIPFERLEAQPTAERCAPCQENYEKTHLDATRGASM